MRSQKRNFIILLFLLAVFTAGAALFSVDENMVYENTEEEETETSVSVSSEAFAEEDFFTDFRIGREKRRDEKKELYETILRDPSRGEEAKAEAEAALSKLYRVSALEDQVEDILIGRNYKDVLFVAEEQLSLLIIDQKEISDSEKEALIAFVSAYAGIPAENITVFTAE